MHCLNCIRCMQNSTFETGLREATFSIFDQRDGEKDDVTMVKKTKYVV